MAGSIKRFEDKPCLAIGRGRKAFVRCNILHDPVEVKMFLKWAKFELELPWFTVIVIDNF